MSNERSFGTSVVIPGELAVGPSPTDEHLEALVRLGVTAVLSLQERAEAPAPPPSVRQRIRWARVPVADGHAGGSMDLAQLGKAAKQIQHWRDEGRMVYVHCYAGVGRAPTVCAAFLAASLGMGLGEALARVKAAHPRASPTAQQLVVLAQFVNGLKSPRDGG